MNWGEVLSEGGDYETSLLAIVCLYGSLVFIHRGGYKVVATPIHHNGHHGLHPITRREDTCTHEKHV